MRSVVPLAVLLLLPLPSLAFDPLDPGLVWFAVRLAGPGGSYKGAVEVRAGDHPVCLTRVVNETTNTAHVAILPSGILAWEEFGVPDTEGSLTGSSLWQTDPAAPAPTVEFFEGSTNMGRNQVASDRWTRVRKLSQPGAFDAPAQPYCFKPGSSYYAIGSSRGDKINMSFVGFEVR